MKRLDIGKRKELILNFNVNGTLIWYYYICKRETWLIGHGIEADQDNEFLVLGNHIHDIFYKERKKEILIDNTIKIDIMPNSKIIGEIKKSGKFLESAKMQVAFYLYYMKYEKNVELEGVLLIPEERKRIEINLNPDIEKELENTIEDIKNILSLEKPPPLIKIPYCKNCAYKELCWA